MPKPIIWSNKCYIDFKGELELKSALQLDLYVDGLNRIRRYFLGEEADLGVRYKTGVLISDQKVYFDTEKLIREQFQKVEYSSKYIEKIYSGLEELKNNNIAFEKELFYGAKSQINISNYLDQLLDVMSYMIVQWLSFDVSMMSEISRRSISDMSFLCSPVIFEPYHIRQKRAYYELLKNTTEENLQNYILQYAFLLNFEIDRNDDEDIVKLENRVSEDRLNLKKFENELMKYEEARIKSRLRRQKMVEEVLASCDDDEFIRFCNNLALMRMSADEEEERHYQQARAVRNLRIYLENHNMNIYSGIADIVGR